MNPNSSFRMAGRCTNAAMLVVEDDPGSGSGSGPGSGQTAAIFYDREEPGEILGERAVACLNACRGIEDPKRAIKELADAALELCYAVECGDGKENTLNSLQRTHAAIEAIKAQA
jgi:hypothetical protein